MLTLKRWRLFVGAAGMAICVAAAGLRAQFDDTFDEDPFASGDWIGNSAGWDGPVWVPPGSAMCADPNLLDPLDPCTVDEEYDGYVVITPGALRQAGNFFRSESNNYDNFKLTVEVELRDGTLGRPADGMVVTVIGGVDPPSRTGTGGGGMGAPCVGGGTNLPDDDMLPQLAWEFDNWSCNTGDSGTPGITGDAGGFPDSQWHHVAFSYSPTGFPCGDAIQPQVFVPFRTSEVPLHNKQPPPAAKNRFRMTVYAQLCGGSLTVACDLEAIDQGINLGRVYTHVVEDFEPFEGYLGVTASTGDASQNHILHSAKLEPLPVGFCLQPAGESNRDITVRNPDPTLCGDYQSGTIADVSLTLSKIRPVSDCCTAATAGSVVETVPNGWTISAISDGGTAAGQKITWNLSGGNFAEGKVLTYTATATGAATGAASFSGSTDDGAGGVKVFTRGETSLSPNQPFDTCGRIKCWNILSALTQPGGAAPLASDIQLDYLTDGSQTELDFVFEPGAEIAPDFSNSAASTGVFEDPNGHAPNAASGIATVTKYVSPTGFIDLNNVVYGGAPDNVMTYAQIYVIADADKEVYIASDSDDSIQIILNEQEVWLNSSARGNDAGCPLGLNPQPRSNPNGSLRDVTAEPVTLFKGENRLIVKTFEGGGDFNFELRFENAAEKPVTQGLSLRHSPLTPTCRVPPVLVTRVVDTSREIGGKDAWSSTDIGGTAFDVSLSLSDVRAAAGICAAAGNVTITDTVPLGWVPSGASAGGTINGRDVSWTIPAANGTTLTYKVSPDGDLVDVSFSGAVTEPASTGRFGVRGERTVVYAPSPFGRENPSDLIRTNFDADIGFCPDGWTCNTGAGLFNPVVDADGRLQLSCATDAANCGGGATSVLWNDPLDLTTQSFTAEFDVFLSAPAGAAPADALTFVVLDADNPLTQASPPTFVGAAGGGDGYAGLTGFAVEFDLWQNDATEPSGYNIPALAFTHMAVIKNGAVLPHAQTHLDVLGPDTRPTFLGGTGWPEMVDFSGGIGLPIHCEIDYNNGNLQVFMEAPATVGPLGEAEPAFPRTKVLDTVLTFTGGLGEEPVIQNAWVGFTAGTGGALINSAVDDVSLTLYQSGGVVGTPMHRGDADDNGVLQLTDAIRILGFLFLGGAPPTCLDAGDADDNGVLQLTDAIRVLGFLFLGGAPPAPPGPPGDPCGVDPGAELGCASYTHCP